MRAVRGVAVPGRAVAGGGVRREPVQARYGVVRVGLGVGEGSRVGGWVGGWVVQ